MRAAARIPIGAPSHEEQAIARTVIYAALFDYPLTLAQVRQSLIASVQTEAEVLALYHRSPTLRSTISYEQGFFFPSGRRDLVAERRRREQNSMRFLARHRRVLRLICALPYVRLVALSGSVAHLNLDGDGDLDLFVIARRGRVWLTTVAIVLLAKLLRSRKTVCVNFVLSDQALAVEPRDLFTANQILHLKPVSGHDVFATFLAANPYVHEYFPNFSPQLPLGEPFAAGVRRRWWQPFVEQILAVPSRAADALCRRAYGAYLRRRAATWRSPGQVRLEPDCVKLHTHSHRDPVLARFEAAVEQALGCDLGVC